MADLMRVPGVTEARVHDVRIAAICLTHGVCELWTADRDFSDFPRLRTRNPVVA
jgi:predicted nucleic acid-binding protein